MCAGGHCLLHCQQFRRIVVTQEAMSLIFPSPYLVAQGTDGASRFTSSDDGKDKTGASKGKGEDTDAASYRPYVLQRLNRNDIQQHKYRERRSCSLPSWYGSTHHNDRLDGFSQCPRTASELPTYN